MVESERQVGIPYKETETKSVCNIIAQQASAVQMFMIYNNTKLAKHSIITVLDFCLHNNDTMAISNFIPPPPLTRKIITPAN